MRARCLMARARAGESPQMIERKKKQDKSTKKGYFVISIDISVNYNIATLYESTNPQLDYTSFLFKMQFIHKQCRSKCFNELQMINR